MHNSVVTISGMANDTISDRIKHILATTGLSERALAKKAGLTSSSHINVLIRRGGEGASVATLRKIAEAASVRLEWLMAGEGDAQALPDTHTPAPDSIHHPSEIIDVPCFGALPPWPMLLRGAKAARPQMPSWVWLHIEGQRPQLVADPTVGTIVKLADLVAENETPPPDGEDPRKYWNALMAQKRAAALKKLE